MNIYNGEPISKDLNISKEEMLKLKFKTGDVVKVVNKDRYVPCTKDEGVHDYKNGDVLVILCYIGENKYEYYLGSESHSGRIIFQEEVDFCENIPEVDIEHYTLVAKLLRHDINQKIDHITSVKLFSKRLLFSYNSVIKDESFARMCLSFVEDLKLKLVKFYLGESIEIKYSDSNGSCVRVILSQYIEDYKESKLLSFRSTEPYFITKRSGKGFFNEDKMICVEKYFSDYMSKILLSCVE